MRDNIWRKHWRRYRVLVLGSAVTLAVTVLAGTATASTQAGAAPGTLLPGSVRLDSVYCTASSDCWAVGVRESKASALLNQFVHWNGKKWAAVAAPNPAGTKMGDSNEPSAVRCTSAVNCWAVGEYDGTTSSGPEALHWNGMKWAQVPVPTPSGTGRGDFTNLIDVACTSASSCWAAGDYGNDGIGGETEFNLLLHWTGKKWFKVKAPNPAGTKMGYFNFLDAIRCASPKDCWAAGSGGIDSGVSISLDEMLHWNGTKWSAADVPSPGGILNGAISELSGLSCASASNCWAVGDYGGDSINSQESENDALQWNGHTWTQVKTPNPDGTGNGDLNELNSVNCSGPGNCWAVGNLGTVSSGGAQTGEVLHWKGTKWTLTKAPNPGGTADGDANSLESVRCVSQKDCWIVGYSQNGDSNDLNLMLHWNSTKWSVS
jgi:hypothetical protein